jgi:hypothetical protein
MSHYTTSNGAYGKPWLSTQGKHPMSSENEVKSYRKVSENDLMQKTGLKILKAKVMREKLIDDIQSGEPDAHHYDPCVPYPKVTSLNIDAKDMKYPESGLTGASNPKYSTRNGEYGRVIPMQQDLPSKFYPISNKFTDSFWGGRIPDTGLNTFLTPSRVHYLFDA